MDRPQSGSRGSRAGSRSAGSRSDRRVVSWSTPRGDRPATARAAAARTVGGAGRASASPESTPPRAASGSHAVAHQRVILGLAVLPVDHLEVPALVVLILVDHLVEAVAV